MNHKRKDLQILRELETLCSNLGIDLRYEKGDFEGGLCRVEKEQLLIINKTLSDQAKIRVLARELRTLDLENIYMVPALRRIIGQNLESAEELSTIDTIGETDG